MPSSHGSDGPGVGHLERVQPPERAQEYLLGDVVGRFGRCECGR